MLLSSFFLPLVLLQGSAAPQHPAKKPDFPKPLSSPSFLAKQKPIHVAIHYAAVVQKHYPEIFYYTVKGDFNKTREKARKELVAERWTLRPGTWDTYEVIFTRKAPRSEVKDQELTLSRGKMLTDPNHPWKPSDDPNWTTVTLKEVYTNPAGN